MQMFHFFLVLIILPLSLLQSESMPWRTEPYALLLIHKAHQTKRIEDKKEYLKRIKNRLHLTLPKETFNERECAEAINQLHTLFYAKEPSSNSLDYLSALFPVPEKLPIVEELKKIDKETSWKWTELQLAAFCLDMKPVIQTLETIEDKIEAINWYLYFLGEIRYPPLNEANKRVDLYSSIGPILSSRQGICLGTTILFAAICQKFSLPVVTFTPPGHIFAAVPLQERFRVVETTARGANVPLFYYENIGQPPLEAKTLISLQSGYIENKAAQALIEHKFDQAKELYLESKKTDQTSTCDRMLALCYLLLNQPIEAAKLAKESLKTHFPNDALLQDIAALKIPSSIATQVIDLMTDESSSHVESNCEKLLKLNKEYPYSLAIRYHAAMLLIELHQNKEAQSLLATIPLFQNDTPSCLLLQWQIASNLEDRNEELRTTIELLKIALKEKYISQSMLDFCLNVLYQNPDCKELSSLIQRGFTLSRMTK